MQDIDQEAEVIETTPAEPPTTAIATIDIRDASAEGVALMRQRVESQKQMMRIALSLTSPNQWTVFSGTDRDGVVRESVYPTGGAADTILRRAFGLTWGEKVVTVAHTDAGPEATSVAWLMNGDRRVEQFEGKRRMGGYIKTEADMRKGSVENMKSVAVRDILGLRFRSPAELAEMGLDVKALPRRAEMQSHAKQGSGLTAPFGRQKGALVSDLEDDNLDWMIRAIGESVADQSKSRWRAKNQELLTACEEERARRMGGGGETAPPAESFDDVGPGNWGESDGA